MYLKDTNESLTRIGPRTPMGDVLRRFWLPVLLAHELPGRDEAPVEVRLLGEDLETEYDAQGELGLSDRYFKEMAPYPVLSSGGVAWTYMGPKDFKPQLPVFGWSALPPVQRSAAKHIERSNWAYAVEGSLAADTRPIFLPPFYTSATPDHGHAHVPIDDNTTCVWSLGAHTHAEPEVPAEVLDNRAVMDFQHVMIALARDNARGHAPDAASHGEWYSVRPFPA